MSDIYNIKIHPIKKKFKDIAPRDALGIWGSIIPEDTICYVAEYPQGYRITCDELEAKNASSIFRYIQLQRPLAVVLSGRAEICETYNVHKCVAYRPIRILNPGDLFGDFDIIDHILGSVGDSRPNEAWSVYAGIKSVLLTLDNPIKNKNILRKLADQVDSDLHCPHMIFDYIFEEKTVIGFINSDFIKINTPFFNELIASAWTQAKTYRNCINSFNFSTLLKFRQKTKTVCNDLHAEKARKDIEYSLNTSIKALFPIFCDAIYDAYNRPLRDEPMFSECRKLEEENVIKKLESLRLLPKNILIASHEKNEFFFPIDYSNYLLASHYDSDTKLDEAMARIFGVKQQPNNKNGTTPRDFYRDIANKLLGVLSKDYPNYPFEVKCKDMMGSKRNQLILHFKKKT